MLATLEVKRKECEKEIRIYAKVSNGRNAAKVSKDRHFHTG